MFERQETDHTPLAIVDLGSWSHRAHPGHMGRRSTAAAVAAGTAAAAGVLYIVVATAKPRRGSWRFKFRTWLCIKWPLTYKYLTIFDARPSGDDADRVARCALPPTALARV